MNSPETLPASETFIQRLRTAGIEPGDDQDVRLSKSLLMLATGLVTAAMMVWVGLYNLLGLNFSANLPLLFQGLLVGNLLLYIATRNFDFYRVTQLGLFLFLPFVAQWSAGNLIVSSGVVLWGILGPIGASLCMGARQSMSWFIAWAVLMAVSGGVDYFLADPLLLQKTVVPIRTSLVFFTLNLIVVAGIGYLLLCFSIEEKRRIQERLAKSRQQVLNARVAADSFFVTPLV